MYMQGCFGKREREKPEYRRVWTLAYEEILIEVQYESNCDALGKRQVQRYLGTKDCRGVDRRLMRPLIGPY